MSSGEIQYPNGVAARAGDIVWAHEGTRVYKVVEVFSAELAKSKLGVDEGGVMLSYHIGPFDLGGHLYLSPSNFEDEWVYPLEEDDMRTIENMFRLLGKTLGIEIWGNPLYAYYPSLRIEIVNGIDKEVWYLSFQAAADVVHAQDTEQCYRCIKGEQHFERLAEDQMGSIRWMPIARGGGPIPHED